MAKAAVLAKRGWTAGRALPLAQDDTAGARFRVGADGLCGPGCCAALAALRALPPPDVGRAQKATPGYGRALVELCAPMHCVPQAHAAHCSGTQLLRPTALQLCPLLFGGPLLCDGGTGGVTLQAVQLDY